MESPLSITEIIRELEESVSRSKSADGLPEEVFLLVSRLTPLVCVDLLIKDQQGRTLFTWRDDEIFGQGWHLPGGVIRHNETFESRILKVGEIELGTALNFNREPLTFVQDIDVTKKNRGHFIAFLYQCTLHSEPDERLRFKEGKPKVGEWAWFSASPDPLLKVHEVYKSYY